MNHPPLGHEFGEAAVVVQTSGVGLVGIAVEVQRHLGAAPAQGGYLLSKPADRLLHALLVGAADLVEKFAIQPLGGGHATLAPQGGKVYCVEELALHADEDVQMVGKVLASGVALKAVESKIFIYVQSFTGQAVLGD